MGFPTARFVRPVDPNLVCGICSGVLDDPTLTSCGHTFCEGCMTTWLDTSTSSTCPECRATVDKRTLRPILSLRNFIQGLEVTCSNKSRGCTDVMKIESEDAHQTACHFAPVDCQACGRYADQLGDIAERHSNCQDSNLATAQKQREQNHPPPCCHVCGNGAEVVDFTSKEFFSFPQHDVTGSSRIVYLLRRISSLEKQVARLLDDLHEAHRKNSLLYFRNRCSATSQRSEPSPLFRVRSRRDDSLNEDNIASQQDIAKLSLLIARYLLRKPSNIDRDEVFQAIRQCYEMQFRVTSGQTDSKLDHDIHMLLATAFSSNWFSAVQRITLGCWLQCLLRSHEESSG